jgi:hypothetical protein
LYEGGYWTNVETWRGAESSNYDADLDGLGADLIVTRDLPDGQYAINVFDLLGDGMCCDNGIGTFEVVEIVNEHEENVIWAGGNFRSHASMEFSVVNGAVQVTRL